MQVNEKEYLESLSDLWFVDMDLLIISFPKTEDIRKNLKDSFHLILHKPCFPLGRNGYEAMEKPLEQKRAFQNHDCISLLKLTFTETWLIGYYSGIYFITCEMKIKVHQCFWLETFF